MDDLSACELRDELPWLEGAILAAMRTWVLGCKRGTPTDMTIRTMFANLRAPEAADHLGRFMQGLNKGCTRMIDIYCTCEPVVSADEVLLLDVLAVTQMELHDVAVDLLRTFVDPSAAYAASGDALTIVRMLENAGRILARGPAAMRRHGQSVDDPFKATGTIRLH